MTHKIVDLDRKRPAPQQVWEHERRAREAELQLVVELHAKKDPVSRAIGGLWRERGDLVNDTLSGIYLLRADLLAIGPKAALALSPYALFGVPLFVAWNPLGQVLTRAAFSSRERDDIVATLSAFFEDVSQGRKHTLHPAPRIGNTPPSRRAPQSATIDTAGEPLPGPAEPHPGSPTTAGPTAVEQLTAGLDAFLANALDLARSFLRQHELRDDLSLHSLRQLDAVLDERTTGEPPEGRFLAALGVYLGSVVASQTEAEWFVDATEQSPIDALCLRVVRGECEEIYRPVVIALDRLRDEEKGFYGHAVAMCRRL